MVEAPANYIVSWRKTAAMGSVLEWDIYHASSLEEARHVVDNIKKHGVIQYYTYVRGPKIDELSSEF